jgi:hypothetical protein
MNGAYKYDFTTDSSQVYGGTAGSKPLSLGKWGMPAGDTDANGQIDADDLIDWNNEAGNQMYSPADLNLDGQIDHKDINNFWIWNLLFYCQVPEQYQK